MATISFTPNLKRHIKCPSLRVTGSDLGSILTAVFTENPGLRSYVVDDQGRLRRHVNVFVDSEPVRDRTGLSDPVRDDSEVFVMQALSGG